MNSKQKDTCRGALGVTLCAMLLSFGGVLPSAADNAVTPVNAPTDQQQASQVRGTVTDNNGDPIIGASVRVKGSSTGTITDVNGNYTLQANRGDVIEISYVGFSTKEVRVTGANLNVTLSEDETTLDDLVVVGYGVVKKSDLTGAIGSVSAKDIKNNPQTGITNMLQGKIAGVTISSTNGNGDMKIRVRGTTSLNKSNEPLWVVDGVIGAPQPSNPDDIESIEVLKDASSTAVYGAQGANGVILVTTKKAKEGQRITFDSRLTWNTLAQKPDLMNAYEYAKAYNDFNGSFFSADQLQGWKDGTLESVDWVDALIRTGFNQRYGVSMSGGSQRTQYSVTGAFSDNKAQVVSVKSRSYNLKGYLKTDIAKWLTFDGYLYMSGSKSHNSIGSDIFLDIYRNSPSHSMFVEGTNVYMRDNTNSIHVSPMSSYMSKWTDSRSHGTSAFGQLTFKIIDGLTFTSSLLYSRSDSWARQMKSTTEDVGAYSSNNTYNSHGYSFRNINNLTYMKQFGDHRITATGVAEYSKSKSTAVSTFTAYLANEDQSYWNLAGSNYTLGSSYSTSAMASYMGRLIYSYKDRYIITGTLRADGASQLSKDNRWEWFPSIGVAWNAHEENFVNKDIFSQLKFRFSYGAIGNANIDPYSTIDRLAFNNKTYTYGLASWSATGYWPGSGANPNLKWERTTQADFGVDLGLFNNRVTLSADIYLKKTTDLLFLKNVPFYYGTTYADDDEAGSVWVNQGEVRNKGLELTVSGLPVVTKDFSWESTFTAAYNRNKVVDLGGEDLILPDAGGTYGSVFALHKGSTVGKFYLYDWAGYDDAGANLWRHADGTVGTSVSGDDKIITGKSIPDWVFGWNNSFSYKNWDASFAFRWTSHYDRLNVARFVAGASSGPSRFITLREAYYANWDKVADKGNVKFASFSNGLSTDDAASTKWLEGGSFLRLQTLAIGYTFPRKWTHFADIHLGFAVENLFVISGYRGLDPETVTNSSGGFGDASYGLDTGSMPMPRSYQLSVRFEF